MTCKKPSTASSLLRASVLVSVWLAAWSPAGSRAQSAGVALRVRAINPSEVERQKVTVRATLPAPARPEDVLDAGGLDIAYDVTAQAYYAHKEVELEPKQSVTFDVVLRDIWVVPESEAQELEAHAATLADALRRTEQADTARALQDAIAGGLRDVRDRQKAFDVTVAKPVDHIRAYEVNRQVLERVRRDVGLLENLAIGAGVDPRRMMGAADPAAAKPRIFDEAETNTVVVRIQVTNPSPTTRRAVPLRRDLPAEIAPTDVLDSGGLSVGADTVRGVTYVYLADLELDPLESRTFEVVVRNKWSGLPARAAALEAAVTNLAALAKQSGAYPSVGEMAREILTELGEIRQTALPGEFGEQFVAAHRALSARLDGVQGRVRRLEELFQPRQPPQQIFGAPLLNVRPPSRRTTWMIIYIILGFLALFSLLFFLRWYGKSRAERLAVSTGAPAGPNSVGTKEGARPTATETASPGDGA